MLTGDNGILTQAQKAKEETERAQLEEENILSDYEEFITGATGVVTGGEWNEEKGVNTPALKGNMELVRYENGEWVEDETGSNYSYVAGRGTADNNSSEWANARVTVDGVDSYFVWIPRYEYKIDSGNQTIDVKFIPTSKTQADEGYIIHSAFTNNIDNGGWTSELSGIWGGKYESARVDATSESEGTSTKIKVQANVKSFRNETIGDMYTYAKEYSSSLNSHMLRNSEWGAVAYLTHSQYGRNGNEVAINDNPNFITSDGDFLTNINQSSTGNIYGVYDLSGGTYEYVASYYSGTATSSNIENYGKSFARVSGTSNQYAIAYKTIDNIIGDATQETANWNGNYADFVNAYNPFFIRGGGNEDASAGIFYFSNNAGDGKHYFSFRECLVIQ